MMEITLNEETFPQLREQVLGMVNTLSPLEQRILRGRFALESGQPIALSDLSAELGLSQGYIIQLEQTAIEKLRNMF